MCSGETDSKRGRIKNIRGMGSQSWHEEKSDKTMWKDFDP